MFLFEWTHLRITRFVSVSDDTLTVRLASVELLASDTSASPLNLKYTRVVVRNETVINYADKTSEIVHNSRGLVIRLFTESSLTDNTTNLIYGLYQKVVQDVRGCTM